MDDLVAFIVTHLVEHPEAARVERVADPRGMTLAISVAPGDVGQVIGRQGRVVKAIRTLVHHADPKVHHRVQVRA